MQVPGLQKEFLRDLAGETTKKQRQQWWQANLGLPEVAQPAAWISRLKFHVLEEDCTTAAF